MSMANIKSFPANVNDIQWVIQNMEEHLVSPFKSMSVKQLFETSPWSLISKCDYERSAFAAFLDYPSEDHYSKLWYESVQARWKVSKYHGVKTIFLHLFVCKFDIILFLENILKETFRAIPSLEWCCIVSDDSKPIDPEIEKTFCEDKEMGYREFRFWFTNRSTYISKVAIRSKQSKDYLALKNMFSQMYGPFKNNNLKKLSLDFLDYGEDRCPTLKYFTFDDDNTYIGMADNSVGEAVGFMYATIQRIDLDLMNNYFQLENVYGLRKKHPADKCGITFGASSSEESSDEEDEIREMLTNIIDEVDRNHEVKILLNDILDEVSKLVKTHRQKKFDKKGISVDKEILEKHPDDKVKISFSTSSLVERSNKKDQIRKKLTDINVDIDNNYETEILLNNVIDEVSELTKNKSQKTAVEKEIVDAKTLENHPGDKSDEDEIREKLTDIIHVDSNYETEDLLNEVLDEVSQLSKDCSRKAIEKETVDAKTLEKYSEDKSEISFNTSNSKYINDKEEIPINDILAEICELTKTYSQKKSVKKETVDTKTQGKHSENKSEISFSTFNSKNINDKTRNSLNDLLAEVCELPKTHGRKKSVEKETIDTKTMEKHLEDKSEISLRTLGLEESSEENEVRKKLTYITLEVDRKCETEVLLKDILDEISVEKKTIGTKTIEKHLEDKSEISFSISGSEDIDYEITTLFNDNLDEVCELTKTDARKEFVEEVIADAQTFINSNKFNLANSKHISLIEKNVKHFSENTLIRLINSSKFNVNDKVHMKLVSRLGKSIKDVKPNRIREILNSDLFDASTRNFSVIALHVLSYMPEHKLSQFQKSEIGYEIYEKVMYEKIKARETNVKKTTKKTAALPKLSFKDTQIILHYTKKLKKEKDKTEKPSKGEKEILPHDFKDIHYRNMGFISGLTTRGNYKIQRSCLDAKVKSSFDYEHRKCYEDREKHYTKNEIQNYEKYPEPDIEKERSFLQEIPQYNGGTNCFYVEQFAIEKEYEYQSLYLIMSAFEYFPRVDYCMLLLPYGTKQVPYLRSHFSSIPARPFSAYDQELFVFHKAAFNRSHEVRIYSENDFTEIECLVQCSCLKEYLLEDLKICLQSMEKDIKAVVLVSEGQIFGIAVVQMINDEGAIRKKYDIAQRINMIYHKHKNQGLLLHCVVHPIFKYFSNVFLKETMRLCQKSILYYKLYPTHLIPYNPSFWQSLCNVLHHFTPLKLAAKAKKIKSYIVTNNTKEADDFNKIYNDEYYCLCYTCTKLVLKGNNINSSRIVIIGDSNLALGILENLIYRDNIRYTNISIITKFGIREEFQLNNNCYSFLPIDTDYTKSKLDSLCLPAWVMIVKGEVLSIQRNSLKLQEMSTSQSKSFVIEFDYLIICSDLEFQTLYVKKQSKRTMPKQEKYSLLSELWQNSYIIAKNPSNVFSVNNAYEAAKVLNWLWRFFLKRIEKQAKKHKSPSETDRIKEVGRIVVYGNYLEAYTALAILITEFPLSKITFIKSPSDTSNSIFHSKFVMEAIDHVLEISQLDLYTNAMIEYDKETDKIRHLDVKTEKAVIRLDCCALLLYHEKNVNYNSFEAFHNSALSFTYPTHNSKGHPYLLINPNFQTNIKNVFAVGTVTEMYTTSKKFVRFEETCYNKREVGMIVGENVNKVITDDSNLPELEFPIFTHHEVIYAKLPYDYFYILIISPNSVFTKTDEESETEKRVEKLVLGNLKTGANIIPAPITKEESELLDQDADSDEKIMYEEFLAELRDNIQDQRQETEEAFDIERILPDNPDYFGLSFDKNETVQTIECFTKKDIDVYTLRHLHGIKVTEIYKIIQKVKEDSDAIHFHLAKGWILPLDHVVFEEKEIKPRKRGYEGYWRLGYPRNIKGRLNEFLDSFVAYKDK